jgi:hypothetical protein
MLCDPVAPEIAAGKSPQQINRGDYFSAKNPFHYALHRKRAIMIKDELETWRRFAMPR